MASHTRWPVGRNGAAVGDLLPPSGTLTEPSTDSNLSNFREADQYFTILFDHYREDFTGELRKAINEFRKFRNEITFPGGIERPVIEGGHYFQVLQFHGYDLTISMADYKTLQKDFKWNRSEHLKTNALVAISNDCFTSWTYAVVVDDGRPDRRNRMNQNWKKFNVFRKQRAITVQPYQGASLDHLRRGSLWIIDPDPYFESYRPVLTRIREIEEDRSLMPFKEYIIDKSPHVFEPAYLENEHPEDSVSGFDDSQQGALRYALTHEVALIQGAPGTGKTLLGVHLIRILSSLRTQDRRNTKIVILSFTNHAVDNFVLECERVGVNIDGLVRMGGQYCEDMARFSLESRKNQWRRGVPGVLKRANIIAMTTTGGAKYQSLMDQVQPEVVLVEEAAHITEAHLIAALPASCEHLIMLGDYWQLKPHITEHAKKFLLDVSLFERLIRVGLPSAELELQYRMHPDLASVMVPHIYPALDSAQRCTLYPSVKGVLTRVVFFNHGSEDAVKDVLTTKSRINFFERDFLCHFCRYLLLQGYKESSITILSTYKEQMHAIFDLLKELDVKVTDETSQKVQERDISGRPSTSGSSTEKEDATEGVRVTTVDAFQGEQNDIVLVSFVASSPTAFLDINRVSAALSCARHGFYAMGNFKAYRESAGEKLAYHMRRDEHYADIDALGRSRARNVKMWPLLYDQWIAQDVLLGYMPIVCEKHGHVQRIRAAEFDFYSPAGGCQSQCGEWFCAHHQCEHYCHPGDNHTNFCSQLLTVINDGVHIKKSCEELKTYPWQGTELVEMSFSECNHKRLVSYTEVFTTQCVSTTIRARPECGHSETGNCGEPFRVLCMAQVILDLKVYGCQHRYSVSCYNNKSSYLRQVAQQCKKMVKFTCSYCKNSLDVECNDLPRTTCRESVQIRLACGHSKNVICRTRTSASALTCERIVHVDRACGHRLTNVYCYEKTVELRKACRVSVTKKMSCGHDVTYDCCKKSEYERDDYRCTTLRKLTRPCGHEQSVPCYDFWTIQATPCRAKVVKGFLFWKKYYECHDYQRLNP